MADHSYIDEILAAEVEEIKYSSEVEAMIMSTPPHKNIIVQSPIGSGKSTALTTAMLQRVDRELKYPQAICVVPDRESAIQNMDLLSEMGKDSPITSEIAVPPKDNYIPLLKKSPVKAQVITGTPVTISNLIVARKLAINDMKMLLIDDADHVLAEPGFKDKVVKIMKDISERPCPPQCQVIMCFTISSDAVEAFVSKIKQVLSEKEFLSFTVVKQYKVNVPDEPSKVMAMAINNKLLDLIAEAGQTIVFVHPTVSAHTLCMFFERLEDNRCKYKTLDGADTQEQRDKILEFKEKRFQVLISTKILDGVFDPSQVGLVVFYEQYSHCIGRAGQFGRKGAVFNLMFGDKDKRIMENIEKLNNVTGVAEQ